MPKKIGDHVITFITKDGACEILRCNHPAITGGLIVWSDKEGERYAESVSNYKRVSHRKGNT